MEQAARASPLFCGCEVRRIPNGVDRNEFRPVGHLEARAALGIDPASRCVLWAASSLGDPRKGFLQFEETMLRLRQRSGPEAVTVLLVGRGDPSRSTLAQAFPVRHFGHVDDTLRLSTIFSAADIFVSTSVQDNLPNVILEVLACGTPVAGFDAGGVPDMVKNNENGCLVAVNDCAALAGRIGAMLGDPGRLKAMRRKAVDIIAREFSSELQARRCADLYREIRGTAGGRP
jgi:glycosyltransferase involved in cell wall biosynthesis